MLRNHPFLVRSSACSVFSSVSFVRLKMRRMAASVLRDSLSARLPAVKVRGCSASVEIVFDVREAQA